MRDLLLFAIVCGLVPAILWRPWFGVLAWFWVGLMVPHAHTWGFMRTFPIASVIGATTLVALLIARDRQPLPFTREVFLLLLFAFFMAVTSWFAVYPSGAWAQWQHNMKILLITFVTPMLLSGRQRIVWLLLVITASIGFYGVKGGVFTISTGGSHMVLGPPGRHFLAGNTYIGLAMAMVLPLLLVTARMFSNRWISLGWPLRENWYKPLGYGFYAAFWLTALATLATYSRGALLGILAIAPFLFIRMRHKSVMVVLAFIAIGIVGLSAPERLTERWSTIKTFEEDTSAMQRIQAWGVSWNMAVERPVVGMGMDNGSMGYAWWISYANFEGHWRHVLSPHSVYFQVLGHHGFVGLFIFLTLIGFTYLTLGRIKRTAAKTTDLVWLSQYAWAIQLSLIAYLVAGAFLDVAYFNLLYAFIALAVVMRRELDAAVSVSQATYRRAAPGEELQVHGGRSRIDAM